MMEMFFFVVNNQNKYSDSEIHLQLSEKKKWRDVCLDRLNKLSGWLKTKKWNSPTEITWSCFSRRSIDTMARTLILFQFIRKSYHLLDIDLDQSQKNHQFNLKILLTLLCMILVFVATSAFILFEAETTQDYGACFTAFFMEVFITIFFIINLVKMPKIINLIEMMESFIEESKYRHWIFFIRVWFYWHMIFLSLWCRMSMHKKK